MSLRQTAVAGLVALLAMVVTMSPAVRWQLRESFTRLPDEYTEIYFTAPPAVRGSAAAPIVVVPVSIVDHGAAHAYSVRFELLDRGGRVAGATAVSVHGRPAERVDAVGRLAVPPAGATEVKVLLAGRAQTLHYRINARRTA